MKTKRIIYLCILMAQFATIPCSFANSPDTGVERCSPLEGDAYVSCIKENAEKGNVKAQASLGYMRPLHNTYFCIL